MSEEIKEIARLKDKINKAIEYIKISKDFLEENNIEKQFVKDLLEILGDGNNE